MTSEKSNTAFAPKPNSSISLLPYPYIGFVKNNADPQNMGRLGVWIPELCGDPLNEGSWIICSYCSPFAGSSDINELQNYQDPTTKTVSQQSYGWVGIPPDINTEVMVVFAGGNISKAYWTGCIYQQNMNHMVPGIAGDTTYAGQNDLDGTSLPTVVPVTEYNKAGVTGSPTNVNRPVFQPLATGLMREGLLNDLERGLASTSMRREAPPLMSGWLSPRGSTVHIDDNAQNEFIRLRTRSGAQVLIHETTGYVYINSKNGNAWLEISDSGINGYTNNTMSFRAMGDINLVSGGNITFDAASNIYLRAGKEINLNSATIQFNASGALTLSSGSDVNMTAAGSFNRKATVLNDNSGAVTAATFPAGKNVSDTTSVQTGGTRGVWTASGGSINTIASVTPTHEPWPGHPNGQIPPLPTTLVPVNSPGVPPAGGGGGVSSNLPPATSSCSFGAADTTAISTVNFTAIQNAASTTGVNQATLLAFADMESSFNANAGASSSSAKGLFQFTDGTWNSMVAKYGNQYNVSSAPGSVFDPTSNALMGAQFTKDNQAILEAKGLPVDPGNLYIMHFLGSSGGPAFIQQYQSNPVAIASSLFPVQAGANPGVFTQNHVPLTMSQVYTNLTTKANSKAQAYAAQNSLPAPCARETGTPGAPSSVGGGATPAGGNASAIGHVIDPLNAVASAQTLTGRYWGRDQQCVALLQSSILNLPNTGTWRRGAGNLSSNPPTPGTGIATFSANGTYHGIPGAGTTHACIYLAPASSGNGIKVLEQFSGSGGAHIRDYQNGDSTNVEHDARNYYVINIA